MRKKILFAAIFALLVCAQPLGLVAKDAQEKTAQDDHVVATVNDTPITSYALHQRILLTLLFSGTSPTKENIAAFRHRAFDDMVDEILQKGIAEKYKLGVSRDDLLTALQNVEQSSGTPLSKIEAILQESKIQKQTFLDKITAQILWSKFTSQGIQPDIAVSDEEISATLRSLLGRKDKVSYLLSEIEMPYEEVSKSHMRDEAQRIAKLVRDSKENFAKNAMTFSKAPSAAAGGDVGWYLEDQLPQAVSDALAQAKDKDIIGPIDLPEQHRFVIVQRKDKRHGYDANPKLDVYVLSQVLFPRDDSGDTLEGLQTQLHVEGFRKNFQSCGDLQALSAQYGAQVSPPTPLQAKDMSPHVLDAVKGLRNLSMSKVVSSPQGFEFLIVCEYHPDVDKTPTANSVKEMLFGQKLEAATQEYMRKMRRKSVIIYNDKDLRYDH